MDMYHCNVANCLANVVLRYIYKLGFLTDSIMVNLLKFQDLTWFHCILTYDTRFMGSPQAFHLWFLFFVFSNVGQMQGQVLYGRT